MGPDYGFSKRDKVFATQELAGSRTTGLMWIGASYGGFLAHMGRTLHGSSKANVRVRTPVQEEHLGIWEPHLEDT